MRVRFQADADLNQIIVAASLRRAPEVDFRAAAMAGFESLSDLEVVPQHLAVSAVVDDLLLIWAATKAEEWANRICYLPL